MRNRVSSYLAALVESSKSVCVYVRQVVAPVAFTRYAVSELAKQIGAGSFLGAHLFGFPQRDYIGAGLHPRRLQYEVLDLLHGSP